MASFIVVGFDGSAEGVAALRWALARAAGMQAALRIVHCWTPISPPALRRQSRPQPTARAPRQQMVRTVQRELQAAEQLVPSPPEISLMFSAAGVERALISQSHGAAMLVLGASSAPVLRNPAKGPVAGPLMDRVGCTIVVVDRTGHVATAQPHHPQWGLATLP